MSLPHPGEGLAGMLIDPSGRTIDYLRISLTDRCNLRCIYCMPPEGLQWQKRIDQLSPAEILQVVETAARIGIRRVRLTGGEPLVHPHIIEIVRGIARTPGIDEVSLTTNGMLLEKLSRPLAQAGLRRVNVSLDTLDAAKFKRITRGGDIDRVWRGIAAARAAGLTPIKLNAVVVRGLNLDDLRALAWLTVENDLHVRFIELMPIGNTQDWGPDLPAPEHRYVSVQEMRLLLERIGLEPETAPIGNGPARTFRIPGGRGTVGFIAPLGEHFCKACNRLRLTSDGKLKPCLVSRHEISLREALRSGQPLEDYLMQAVACKPHQHDMLAEVPAELERSMSQIGG